MPASLIGVIISPWATVPVGTEQDTVGEFRTVAGDDVRSPKYRAIIALEQSVLGYHLQPITGELLHDPLTTVFVGLAVHRARTEVALLLTKGISAVGTEGGTHRLQGNIIRVCRLLAKTTGY